MYSFIYIYLIEFNTFLKSIPSATTSPIKKCLGQFIKSKKVGLSMGHSVAFHLSSAIVNYLFLEERLGTKSGLNFEIFLNFPHFLQFQVVSRSATRKATATFSLW